MGTTTTRIPAPIASHAVLCAYVSAMPPASLLIVLNVAGAITTTSGRGDFGWDGSLASVRGGTPVTAVMASAFTQGTAAGVATTRTCHPFLDKRARDIGAPLGERGTGEDEGAEAGHGI